MSEDRGITRLHYLLRLFLFFYFPSLLSFIFRRFHRFNVLNSSVFIFSNPGPRSLQPRMRVSVVCFALLETM